MIKRIIYCVICILFGQISLHARNVEVTISKKKREIVIIESKLKKGKKIKVAEWRLTSGINKTLKLNTFNHKEEKGATWFVQHVSEQIMQEVVIEYMKNDKIDAKSLFDLLMKRRKR